MVLHAEVGTQVEVPEKFVNAAHKEQIAALKAEVNVLKTELKVKKSPSNLVSQSEDIGKYYTGLSSAARESLWDFLGPAKYELQMWGMKKGSTSSTFVIGVEDQFLLFLIKLRRDYDYADLGIMFDMNRKKASICFKTWLQFIYMKFYDIRYEMFVEKGSLPQPLPKCFQNPLVKDTRVAIDCTELFVESSEDFEEQGNMYSNYKSHTTAKVFIAVAPNGACAFVSDCFEGGISDRDITVECGFIDFLNPNDMVLADRGFLIEDLVAERGASLNIPPFLRGRKNFTFSENMKTKVIARARIHVERFNQRFKKFKYLQGVIPRSKTDCLSQAVYVACCLTNYDLPLAK